MSREGEQRAVVVAALRQLADLIEADETLPVPQHGRLQACVALCRPQAERFAAVRAFADRLGLDVIETGRASRTATKFFGPVQYFAHANSDSYDGETGYVERVVPADEDAEMQADTQVAA